MITTLTPEQESKLKEYAKRWTAIGLCTDPADRPKAEEAIKKCYEKGGLEAPKRIVWFGSPYSQAIWSSVRNASSVPVYDYVRDYVRDSVMLSVYGSVSESIPASVGESVWRSVYDSVRDHVTESVGHVAESVYDSILESVTKVESVIRKYVRASLLGHSAIRGVSESVYGAHAAGWLSYFSFMREELGLVEQTEPVTGLLELALHCGWILPCKEVCFASERHNVLKRDERGKLHCMDGPAVSYPDGWNIYATRGIRVPEYVVTSRQHIKDSEATLIQEG